MPAEVVKKYPDYYHPEIIAIREGAEQRKQSREMLKGDINSLEKSEIFPSSPKLKNLRNHIFGSRTKTNEKLARAVFVQ